MIRLNLSSEPHWLTLAPDLRILVAPLTTALMVAARGDPALGELPESATPEDLAVAMAKAVARRAVLDWEGVGDANGNAIPVTPEGIDALLDLWPVFEAFQVAYVAKGLLLDAEKNVSAPSPSGPSAGASGTAQPARRTTVATDTTAATDAAPTAPHG